MGATKSRKARAQGDKPEITARPRSISEDVIRASPAEPGLSVDPEDLGARFLSEATEQGNYESLTGQPPELSIMSGPPSDEPLTGPNFDPDHSVWEQTVDLTLQSSADDPLTEVAPEGGEHEPEALSREVDLIERSIQEASLLDEEGSTSDEVQEPRVDADEQSRGGAKRRGSRTI
jgi:hypothetical protein